VQQRPIVTNNPHTAEFVTLVDAHGPAVLALLRRLSGNRHDADDAFQETAVRVWRSFNSRPRPRNERAWLMTIAYRAFLDQRSRRRPAEALVEPADPRSASPADAAARSEETQKLLAEVGGLPEAMREVVVLHYTGGLTLQETARAIGVSAGTVKSRLNAALKQLRSVLA
jgi:RNA polymerase sigma-70 factor (ECF subfamily)